MTEHQEIWLQPWCGDCELRAWDSETSRQWCKDNVWDDCVVCGAKPVKYTESRPHCRYPNCDLVNCECGHRLPQDKAPKLMAKIEAALGLVGRQQHD